MKWYGVLVALCLVACRAENTADDVDAAVELPDAPDGTGCTALTPRFQDVESFIGPTGLEARIGAMLDGAKSSIDLQMYLFTVDALADKVIAAKNRGITVRVLLDPEH